MGWLVLVIVCMVAMWFAFSRRPGTSRLARAVLGITLLWLTMNVRDTSLPPQPKASASSSIHR